MPWQIEINSDNTEVKLDLRKLTSKDDLSKEAIIAELKENNVVVDDRVENNISNFLSEKDSEKTDDMLIMAQAVPPVPGQNGYFKWAEKFDPKENVADLQDADRSSFYERSSLIIAHKADVLGILHLATSGEAGKDVLGEPIAAQEGEEFDIKPGDNVELQSDGVTFVAACDGEPKMAGDSLSIDPVIHVKGDIDFAVGNVDYSGDIEVKGDIKDLFKVSTGGNIDVEGTIEAAQIECKGSLSVKRGISGKEKGIIKVEENLTAKYLSNVTAWVRGDVMIESEVVNTDLNCSGKIVLKKGAIHGGQVTAAGTIEMPTLGSPAGVRTVIKAAVDPFIDKQIKELGEEKEQAEKKIVNLMPKAKMLLQQSKGKPSKELKEIADEIKRNKEIIQKNEQDLARLKQELADNCQGTIIVHKTIYPGSLIYIGEVMDVVNKEMTGPVEVFAKRHSGKKPTLAFRNPAEVAQS